MKRLIKLLISIVVRCYDVLFRTLLRACGRQPAPICVVLYYHAVDEHHRLKFVAQLEQIIKHATPLSADHVEPLEPNRHYAVITFDDAFVSVQQNALPELQARNLPATIFVPTGSLGARPAWINDSRLVSSETVMSETSLGLLRSDRRILIGSHSVTHPRLARLSETDADRELRDSRATLQRILRQPVELFSFPHGAYNQNLLKLAREAGYNRVFTVTPSLAFQEPNQFTTGRFSVSPADWILEFRLKLLGAYRWMAMASKLKACLRSE